MDSQCHLSRSNSMWDVIAVARRLFRGESPVETEDFPIPTPVFEPPTRSDPRVSQKCLASERRVVLQQIVDVPNPVVFFTRTNTFRFPVLHVITDRRPVDTRNRVP